MSVHTGEVAKPLNSTFDFSSCSPIGKISQKGLLKRRIQLLENNKIVIINHIV